MAENEVNGPLVAAGILGLGGVGLYYWYTKRNGGNGGDDPPPPPAGGLVLSGGTFQAVSFGGGSQIVGVGGTLDLRDSINVSTLVTFTVRNTSSSPKWLGTRQELKNLRTRALDQVWVASSTQGITESVVDVLDPRVIPPKPISIPAGATRSFNNWGIDIEGPAKGFSEKAVWLLNFDPEFSFKIEFLELPSQTSTSGRSIGLRTWDPAFKTDVPLFAQAPKSKRLMHVTGRRHG